MQNQNITEIKELDLSHIVDNATILMISKRGAGKRRFICNILNHFKQKIPIGIIIDPSDKENMFYSDFISESYIYYEFKHEIVQKLFERQKNIIEKAKERKKQGKNININAFIVIDNCLSSKSDWTKDPSISTLLFDGRYYNITFLLTMPYPMTIQKELNEKFDYIFLFSDDTISNQKRIFEYYADIFPNFDFFRKVFLKLTVDFCAMVLAKDNIPDKVFCYKSKLKYSQ